MVRLNKNNKKSKYSIGSSYFKSLPASQQKRIQELNNPNYKSIKEMPSTIKKEKEKEKEKKDVIQLKGKPREKTIMDKVGPKIVKGIDKTMDIASSPKTTAVLGATLAGITGAGLATGALGGAGASSSTAVITQEATALNSGRVAGEFIQKGTTITTQRAIIGKPSNYMVEKIFHAVNSGAIKYATNSKSVSLTAGFLTTLGLGLGAISLVKDMLGTYPFASFIREEAIQTLQFAISKATDAGDLEKAKNLSEDLDEIINADFSRIPYRNSQLELKRFQETAYKSNAEFKEIIKIKKEEFEGTRESPFEILNRRSSEKSRERALKYQSEDTKYYEDLKEKNKQDDLEEMQWKSEYYNLLRAKKYAEADKLLKLKGGSTNE